MGLRTTNTGSVWKSKNHSKLQRKVGSKNDIKIDFEQAEKSADIQLTNTSFPPQALARFHGLDGSMRLLKNRLEIDRKGFNGEESKLKFVGTIEHLFNQNKELQIAGHLSSDWLKMSEMVIADTTHESTSSSCQTIF